MKLLKNHFIREKKLGAFLEQICSIQISIYRISPGLSLLAMTILCNIWLLFVAVAFKIKNLLFKFLFLMSLVSRKSLLIQKNPFLRDLISRNSGGANLLQASLFRITLSFCLANSVLVLILGLNVQLAKVNDLCHALIVLDQYSPNTFFWHKAKADI